MLWAGMHGFATADKSFSFGECSSHTAFWSVWLKLRASLYEAQIGLGARLVSANPPPPVRLVSANPPPPRAPR